MRPSSPASLAAVASGLGLALASALPAQDALGAASQTFDQSIRPLLQQFCLKCHSTEKQKGDLDLEAFTSFDVVRRQPLVWQQVAAQLAEREMPPQTSRQPDEAQRALLLRWVQDTLGELARAHAGDPGPVVLRRLSNAEYTYTVRDLTGLAALDPVREFPTDGAAGEGFTNVGNALVMSPSLLAKYLDAGKGIAAHAVLLPEGIRFAPGTTRRDWTEAILADIKAFYRQFTVGDGGDVVDLQGIVFSTNEGGRLPLAKYLAATLELRDAAPGDAALAVVARRHGLSPKYLATLLAALQAPASSLLLGPIAAQWRACTPDLVPALAARIGEWQASLWKFSSVGHIGKLGGPTAWLEPVDPLVSSQELRLPVPPASAAGTSTLYLVASDGGDGNAHDFAVWHQPRFVAAGRPDLLLRDVRSVAAAAMARRARRFALAEAALAAAADAVGLPGLPDGAFDIEALATRHAIDRDSLQAWFSCLGVSSALGGAVAVDTFSTPLARPSAYEFVAGWGSPETPLLVANSSDQPVRIPGTLKAHGVAVHPSPTRKAAVGWRSPIAATMRVAATVQHAHPACGNGVLWSLELRRGAMRRQLAQGAARGGAVATPPPLEGLAVQRGDLISLLVAADGRDHSCDLTAVDLILSSDAPDAREWDLAKDCSADVVAANPHADRHGNAGVWHFYVEPDGGDSSSMLTVPDGSLLARWQATTDAAERAQVARDLRELLDRGTSATDDSPDGQLFRALASLRGPLVSFGAPPASAAAPVLSAADLHRFGAFGLDPAAFGRGHDGRTIDGADLGMTAPAVVEVRLPADLVAGTEFVTTGGLEADGGAAGSVQMQVLSQPPIPQSGPRGPLPSETHTTTANGLWTSNNQQLTHASPILVAEGSAARARLAAAFDEFRQLFPAALCYAKIVPVDEVVTLTQYHREDAHLVRLMLDGTQAARLDRLWDELHFVSQDALTQVDAFEQIWQFATQDADPSVFEPLRQPIAARAAAFRARLVAAEPKHVEAVVQFAQRAYRRPLTAGERHELPALHGRLRGEGVAHDAAILLLIARVLLAPAFLYHAEEPGPGAAAGPVSDWELASRLSYFLWSTAPDEPLLASAARGVLHEPDELIAQTRRMLRHPHVRRLATEFGCAWLHIHGFDELGEKSERHFPTFVGLRSAMYEESILFLTDLFQRGGSMLDLLDADHTFLNAALADHYGIPGVTGAEWRRVDGVKQLARGGILGQATILATQAGASRTSPILRGNWLSEVLLGEKLPRPPKDVPRLPEDEGQEGLTMRELTEKHTSDPRCAKCHARIDPLGFALEAFDAIGRHRQRDLGGRPIDTHVKAMDGTEFEGLAGLRQYLLTARRDAFVRQFCRKLLGYSLGRAVRLSDEPLLDELGARLGAHEHRLDVLVEAIVLSRQFREIRGRDAAHGD